MANEKNAGVREGAELVSDTARSIGQHTQSAGGKLVKSLKKRKGATKSISKLRPEADVDVLRWGMIDMKERARKLEKARGAKAVVDAKFAHYAGILAAMEKVALMPGMPMLPGMGTASPMKSALGVLKPKKAEEPKKKPKNMGTPQGRPTQRTPQMPPPTQVTPPAPAQGTMKSAGMARAVGRGAMYGGPSGAIIGAVTAPKGHKTKAAIKGLGMGTVLGAGSAAATEHERKKIEESRPPPRYRRSKVAKVTLIDAMGGAATAGGATGAVLGARRGARKAKERGESKLKGAIKGGLKGGVAGSLIGGASVPSLAALIALRESTRRSSK